MTKEHSGASKSLERQAPWDKNDAVIWLASTLTLHRNIEKFLFPRMLENARKVQLLALIAKALLQTKEFQSHTLIKAHELTAIERDFFLEHYLIFDGLQETHAGQAFMLDDTGQLISLINIKDHLVLSLTDTSGDLEEAWAALMRIENTVGQNVRFAFSQKFGFLTSDPMLSGTALIISAFMHVPVLVHLGLLQEHLEKEKNDAIIATGLQGNPEELIGDILLLKNAYTLGVSEEAIISTLRNAILKVLLAEKSARSMVKKEKNAVIQDKISRALGILKYSYQLETGEALSALSLVKLGIELGMIKEMTIREVNQLFFTCRRGHLTTLLKEKIPAELIASERARFFREKTGPLGFV